MALNQKLSLESFDQRREELSRQFFEPQLARLGLSAAQIEKQDLPELNESLTKINDAIANSKDFGTFQISASSNLNAFVISAQQAVLEIGILPLLLERKSLILARIRALVGGQKIESLNDLVATVEDAQLRGKMESEVAALAAQSRKLADQEIALSQEQAEQIAKRDEAVATLRAQLFERRLQAWTGFFAKESMATYVGALLLIILTSVQIVAIFSGSYESDILSNAFLLLLGYFFGQSGGRQSASTKGDKDSVA